MALCSLPHWMRLTHVAKRIQHVWGEWLLRAGCKRHCGFCLVCPALSLRTWPHGCVDAQPPWDEELRLSKKPLTNASGMWMSQLWSWSSKSLVLPSNDCSPYECLAINSWKSPSKNCQPCLFRILVPLSFEVTCFIALDNIASQVNLIVNKNWDPWLKTVLVMQMEF